ncbi:MAG: 4-diphosphocytidyl-2-C-methyl-D-erythritol kinase [Cyclobacteriaceae bacterium]|jgi:4-diphosphocytidyl-2-C-methyl-D-erythritol kinase
MISFPNAKINLGLNILSKRPDGYHNLSSCFYPLGWKDILEIIPSNRIQFTSSGIAIPGGNMNNLCIKAYNLLYNNHHIPPVHIHLHKIIPIGAGLGGGSSDAASTLKMLNNIFNLNISTTLLEEFAGQIGSDCPFFIQNKPILVSGTGTEFNPALIDLSKKKVIIIHPNIHISTKEAYSGIVPKAPKNSILKISKLPLSNWKSLLVNDFERLISLNNPEISNIKKTLYDSGAIYASMSGSGSSVFGIFKEDFDLCALRIKAEYSSWAGIL